MDPLRNISSACHNQPRSQRGLTGGRRSEEGTNECHASRRPLACDRTDGGGREEGGKMSKMERPQSSFCRLLISSMARRVGLGVGACGVGGFDLVGGNERDVELLGREPNSVAAEDSGWGMGGGRHWGN